MHYSRKNNNFLTRNSYRYDVLTSLSAFQKAFIVLLLMLSFSWMTVANANNESQARFKEIQIQSVNPQSIALKLDMELLLSSELQVALNKGMPLFFTLDFKVYKPNSYWFDTLKLEASQTSELWYNMLLREWKVKQEQHEYKAFSFDEALRYITHIDNWTIETKEQMPTQQDYIGKIRLRLDTSLLARPFQITAIHNSSSAWSFSTSWKKFDFLLSDKKFN